MTDPLFLDTETYSSVDLKKCGPYVYTESEDFELLITTWWSGPEHLWSEVTAEDVHVEIGPVDALMIPGLTDKGLKVAHNATFDRLVMSRVQHPGRFLPPSQWVDTMTLCAEVGLPQSLDKAARAVGVDPKDSAGTRLISLFSKPNRKTRQRNRPEDHPEEWADFIRYAQQDTATMIQLAAKIGLKMPTGLEHFTEMANAQINDRGVAVDLDLVHRAIEASLENRTEGEQRLRDLLKIDNPRSVPQFTAGMARLGLELPNLQAATIERTLWRDDLTAEQREALELRTELAGSAIAKFPALVDRTSSDGRVRGMFRFYGAHTGRFSGSGAQLHNLPRASLATPWKAEDDETKRRHQEAMERVVIADLEAGLGATMADLKAMVRPSLLGPMVVSDYSAIEARVLAWLAGETWVLDAFRAGRDIYVETAERMGGGMDRQDGKVATLALGYNGGIAALRRMGAVGSDEELTLLRDRWRAASPRIVRWWRMLQDAFGDGGQVGEHVRVIREGAHRRILLPSGRSLWYRRVRWEGWRVVDEVTGLTQRKEGYRFDSPQGYRTGTYGGKLAENVTQAIARDVLAVGLCNLHQAKLRVVGHVHDEVMVETSDPADVTRVAELMCLMPKWAEGLPLAAAGFFTERYRKG